MLWIFGVNTLNTCSEYFEYVRGSVAKESLTRVKALHTFETWSAYFAYVGMNFAYLGIHFEYLGIQF